VQRRWLLLALVLFLANQQAGAAALTSFATRAEWATAVGNFLVEDFENLDNYDPLPLTGGVFSTPHFDIVVDANHGRIGLARDDFDELHAPGISGNFFVGDVHGDNEIPPHYQRIDFSSPINSFAVNFGGLNEGGIQDMRVAGQSFSIVTGTGQSRYAGFLGVVSTAPFSTVEIRTANDVLDRFSMDNVSFVPVPEPNSIAVGLLILFRRRGIKSHLH
jgi:hypothetical protein